MKKNRFNARLESQCRERIKKAAKVMGALHHENGSKHARYAMDHFTAAVKEEKFISISSEDMERWFNSANG